MRFGLLGPLEVVRDGRPVAVTSAKQRAVLSVLLLHANRVVSADRLIDAVWGDPVPASARNLVATYVWRLRGVLDDRLRAESSGYLLRIDDGELDVQDFDRLATEGRNLLFSGQAARAATVLRAALDLWRGEPLADVRLAGELCNESSWLAEQRITTIEHRIDAELAVGQHAALVGELRHLVNQYPVRERFAGQLMTALYRSGRQSEALTVFGQVREQLAEALGVDPGKELADLHRAILRADAALRAPGAAQRESVGTLTRPAQLPPADGGFHGRLAELDRMDRLLAEHHTDTALAPLVVIIVGMAGVGKTSLAVRWAQRQRDRFPDGQLFATLHGYTEPARHGPLPAVGRFLRALGLPAAAVPVDLDEAVGLYRTILADRNVLIVLDDVAHADTAMALLAGGARGAVVVTSREPLPELGIRHDVHRITLGPFAPHDSRMLLTKSVDSAPDDTAADDLAVLCGHLPLALRLAAAYLAHHPALTLAEYVRRIRRGDRLTELEGSKGIVRAAFDFSYQALSAVDARVFRLLGVVPGHDFAVPAVAALADLSEPEAELALMRLAGAHLLEHTETGRFACHDLLRAYAIDRAASDEPAEVRAEASDRWLEWYLASTVAADLLLDPHRYRDPLAGKHSIRSPMAFAAVNDAVTWLDAERGNVVAAVCHAARNDRPTVAWQLAWALWSYFNLRLPWDDWLDTYRTGLACARQTGDRHGEAVMMFGLGTAHYYPQRFREALSCYETALALHDETGDRRGEGVVLNSIGNVYLETQQFERAVEIYQQALDIQRDNGNPRDEGVVLNNLSEVYGKLARHADAELCAIQALDIQRRTGNRRAEVFTLCHLANARWQSARHPDTVGLLSEALALAMDINDAHGQAWTQTYLGHVMRDCGRLDEASRHWQMAIDLFVGIGDPHAAELRATQATLRRALVGR